MLQLGKRSFFIITN